MPLCHAARAAGVSFQSLSTYRSVHPEFAAQLEQAASKGIGKRLKVVEDALSSSDENVRLKSAFWFLEHAAPEFFAKNRIELTAEGGKPLAPAVVAPTVIFSFPDNGRGRTIDAGSAERKAIEPG
jgi:hypothetical protein